ncbi:MAG: glycosyltransferase, partial [Phycisphaerales bacterium]
LDVESHVEFLGFVQNMADFYSKVDVVMLTSLREDCPMTILEALAAGRFVVAPATGGVPELLRPPVEGAILDESSDFSTVVRRLENLSPGFDSPANREYARQFDIRKYAQTIVSLYEKLARVDATGSRLSQASAG